MQYPIKDMDGVTIDDLGILLDTDGNFRILIKDYMHVLSGNELVTEMTDQLDIRGSVRNALLRKANKGILTGLKKSRRRLDEEAGEAFDLNILIWYADKALKGEHQQYLTK